jgi:hypothetical protein
MCRIKVSQKVGADNPLIFVTNPRMHTDQRLILLENKEMSRSAIVVIHNLATFLVRFRSVLSLERSHGERDRGQ